AITQRVTNSVVAATAAALLYTIAPGQPLNVYWLSAFTVTGASFWLLLTMVGWLFVAPGRRPVVCALTTIPALLSGEHGVQAPALLLVLAVMRGEPLRSIVVGIAPSAAIVAVYLAAKFYYLVIWRPVSAVMALRVYSLTFDIRIWLEHIGQYLVQCSTLLALWEPDDSS